ncbi:Teichoic acid translocation permease protein TagG [Novipirellula aureliae]|uniref:Transport permease protein n=1 Tax=Novipirellula aureliae TaxID=2527966 RepID=A0A5C6E673_9BACT|nr:ABC transporter permease [Novipirellula aureliae]TWU44328.1 Teichoic acid translocation permease protein TagG [Novipirellula aureliae]
MPNILDTTPPVTAGATPLPASVDEMFAPEHITIIEARKGLQFFDWKELVAYRDLFRFLIWRQIKVRYAQSAIGIGWAVIQPLFSMVLFTIIFGRLANIDSDGAPYALFSLAALLPWTYFSNAITDGVSSLVSEANMLRKIYFPRLLLPLSAVVAKLVDFGIAAVMMVLLMSYYQHLPGPEILVTPLLIALMVVTASGISIWLTTLAVQYRDVKHAMTFLVQLGMYASPVVYPTSMIPEQYRLYYALNPMVGVIEGFRSAILGSQPIPWDLLAVGTVSATAVLLTGLVFFRSKEKIFADVA